MHLTAHKLAVNGDFAAIDAEIQKHAQTAMTRYLRTLPYEIPHAARHYERYALVKALIDYLTAHRYVQCAMMLRAKDYAGLRRYLLPVCRRVAAAMEYSVYGTLHAVSPDTRLPNTDKRPDSVIIIGRPAGPLFCDRCSEEIKLREYPVEVIPSYARNRRLLVHLETCINLRTDRIQYAVTRY